MLIGAFAYLSIRGAYRAIGKEREQLQRLEAAMQADIDRMAAIEECWSQVESIDDTWREMGNWKVKCKAGLKGRYLLTVKNRQPQSTEYHYLVQRE